MTIEQMFEKWVDIDSATTFPDDGSDLRKKFQADIISLMESMTPKEIPSSFSDNDVCYMPIGGGRGNVWANHSINESMWYNIWGNKDKRDGFNQCRSAILENINKLKGGGE
jgi:hypothetical protein